MIGEGGLHFYKPHSQELTLIYSMNSAVNVLHYSSILY